MSNNEEIHNNKAVKVTTNWEWSRRGKPSTYKGKGKGHKTTCVCVKRQWWGINCCLCVCVWCGKVVVVGGAVQCSKVRGGKPNQTKTNVCPGKRKIQVVVLGKHAAKTQCHHTTTKQPKSKKVKDP